MKDISIHYDVVPRTALKRFIFFERSKSETRYAVDEWAYREHLNYLKQNLSAEDDDEFLEILQELFYGFSAVLKNRSWFAQSLLPLCPELTFPEAIADKATRRAMRDDGSESPEKVDERFEFKSHLFQARGGEVYFMHILQGIMKVPHLAPQLDSLFGELFGSFNPLATIASWVQTCWEKNTKHEPKCEDKECEDWIPEGYQVRAEHTCHELVTLLSAGLDPFEKMEVLAHGMVLQILRMMHCQAAILTCSNPIGHPAWVISASGCSSASIRRLSAISYAACEDDLIGALHAVVGSCKPHPTITELADRVSIASDDGHKLFRRLGKEIGIVVPPTGPGMRFSLSETILKFLVLAIIGPGRKMLFSQFLECLWEHYGMVIGPAHACHLGVGTSGSETAWLRENESAFQMMLRECGFLRDLSDATAIVENPFER